MGTTRVSFFDFNRAVLSLRDREGYELAIIGGTVLDVALERAINYALGPVDDDTRNRILGDTRGAIGTLGARADMAYALGLITQEAHGEVTTIRKIRNHLAHSLRAADLDEQPISQHIDRLTMVNVSGDYAPRVQGRFETIENEGARSFVFDGERFSMAEVTAIADQHGEIGFFAPVPIVEDPKALSRQDRLRFSVMSVCTVIVSACVFEWAPDTTPEGHAFYEMVPLSASK